MRSNRSSTTSRLTSADPGVLPVRARETQDAPGGAANQDAPGGAANDPPASANHKIARTGRTLFEEPKSVLEAFLVTVVRLAGARAGLVRGLTAESDQPKVVAAWGIPAGLLEQSLDACGGCGFGPGCNEAGDPVLGQACAGTVAIPLEYKGESVGVCTLFFDEVNSLRAEVIHLLRPVGQLFGLALENAKLEREKLQSRLMQERQAMAGEIHDSLAQSLTFLRMRMPLLSDAIDRHETMRAAKYCADITGELGSANRRVRELITHFRAGMDGQGLERALETTARGFYDDSGIRLTLENEVRDLDLDAEREVQVFRIVQEALANVRKHSNARNARVSLGRVGHELRVTVEDDGEGIAPATVLACASGSNCGHFGIEIMRERAAALGGRLEVGRSERGGTVVSLALPPRHSTPGDSR